MTKPEDEEDRDSKIRRQEPTDGELPRIEDREAVAEQQENENRKTDVRSVWLEA